MPPLLAETPLDRVTLSGVIGIGGRLRKRLSQRRALLWSAGALAAAVMAGGVALVRGRVLRFEVEGLSMVPSLGPGDRILVLRTKHLAVGDIAAFPDPDLPERMLVKRVTGVEWNAVRVEGDNAAVSRDSRHFGSVPLAKVTGRVLWCYWSPYTGPTRLGRAAGTTLDARDRRSWAANL